MKNSSLIMIVLISITLYLSCSNEEAPESYIIDKTPVSSGIIATSEAGWELGKIGFPEIGEKRKDRNIYIVSQYPCPAYGPFSILFFAKKPGEVIVEIYQAVSQSYSDPNLRIYEHSILSSAPILLEKTTMVFEQSGVFTINLNPNRLEKGKGFIRSFVKFNNELVWVDSYVTSSFTDPIYNLINK